MRKLAILAFTLGCSAPASAPPPPPPTPTDVSGTVVDDTNAVVANAIIEVCNATLCTLGSSDASGSFTVDVPAGSGYHVIARAPASDTSPTSAGIALVGDVSGPITLPATVVIPVVGPLSDLALDASSDTGPDAGSEAVTFEGAVIPQGQWPAFDPSGETVVAMWALAPWATYETVSVTITNHFGLAAGTTVHVYAVDDGTASLLPGSPGTVNGSGTITGATLDRLTWVVLAIP